MSFDITKVPMVRVTWLDARDTETGWLPIKDILNAPLAVCQEVGYMVIKNQQKIVIMRSWCTDKDDNHVIDLREFRLLLSTYNIPVSEKDVKNLFNDFESEYTNIIEHIMNVISEHAMKNVLKLYFP